MHNHMKNDRTVTVSREKLVTELKKNRELHETIFQEAMVGWRKDVVESATAFVMECERIAAKEGSDFDFHSLDVVQRRKPQSHLMAYDEAIELFSWDEADSVELSVEEFRKFVLDKWDWSERFAVSNSRYSSTARSRHG